MSAFLKCVYDKPADVLEYYEKKVFNFIVYFCIYNRDNALSEYM